MRSTSRKSYRLTAALLSTSLVIGAAGVGVLASFTESATTASSSVSAATGKMTLGGAVNTGTVVTDIVPGDTISRDLTVSNTPNGNSSQGYVWDEATLNLDLTTALAGVGGTKFNEGSNPATMKVVDEGQDGIYGNSDDQVVLNTSTIGSYSTLNLMRTASDHWWPNETRAYKVIFTFPVGATNVYEGAKASFSYTVNATQRLAQEAERYNANSPVADPNSQVDNIPGATAPQFGLVTSLAFTPSSSSGGTLSFTPPLGTPPANYSLTITPAGGSPVTSTIAGSPYSLTGLDPGVAYTITILPAGSTNETEISLPAAPSPFLVQTTLTSITASWSAISGADAYVLSYKRSIDSTWTTLPSTTSTSLDLTGLTPATNYDVRVYTLSGGIAGLYSDIQTALVATAPSAPQNFTVTPTTGTLTLNWDAPASDGGDALTGYTVTITDGASYSDSFTLSPSTTTKTITGLTNGVTYSTSVVATNSWGNSSAASSSGDYPYEAASAPLSFSATPGGSSISASWSAPSSNGGSSITGYELTYATDGNITNASAPLGSGSTLQVDGGTPSTHTITLPANQTSVNLTGLTNGAAYSLTLKAVNASGPGNSATIASVTPRTTTAPVTSFSATAHDSSVSLSWAAPATLGGAALTNYTLSIFDGTSTTSVTLASSATTYTVSSLDNGTAYTFTLVANNAAGSSSSASASATPVTTASAPRNLTLTPAAASLGVSWTAPLTSGGSAITSYRIDYTDGVTPHSVSVSAATLSTSLSGLTNGTSYSVSVVAINAQGDSAAATASSTPYTFASEVNSLNATPGDTSVFLSWLNPSSTGGSSITGYEIDYTDGSTSGSTTTTSTSKTITGLTNGTSYTFTVKVVNAAGSSTGTSTSATPYTVPGAPSALSATAGNASASLSWSAPASNGGNSITDYVIQFKLSSDSTWTTFADGTSTATTATVTGLTNASSYDFRVAATNAAGNSSYSATDSATPYTVPSAPADLSATPGNTQVDLTWSAPASNGRAITGYTITYTDGTTTQTATSASTSKTITGLSNGVSYTFSVVATNLAGDSAASSPVSTSPYTASSAPGGLSVTPGNASADLSWSAPSDNGGRTITDYLIQYRTSAGPGAWTTFSHSASTTTSATVTGLTNGTQYDFQVAALTSAGSGAFSSPTTTTPFTTPDTPTALSATADDSAASLTWTTPASNGGAAITDYLIQYRTSAGPGAWTTFAHTATNATSISITGLSNGTDYDFQVAAINAAGTGNFSSASSTPRTTPGTPTALSATPGASQVGLTWSAPASTGGAAITSYRISYYRTSLGAGSATVVDTGSNSTSATVSGLTNGTGYTFQVAASNAAGTGAYSTTVAGTPLTTPSAPTSLAATSANASASLTWAAPSLDGGSAVSDYIIQYRTTSGPGAWNTFADGTSTSTSATVTGLANGTQYDFQVAAINAAGTGTFSTTATTTPATTPGAPTGLTATAGSTTTALSWTAPSATGGSALTGYTVQYRISPSGSFTTVTGITGTSTTISGLTGGTVYNFQVAAVNAAGTGTYSATATATTTVASATGTLDTTFGSSGQTVTDFTSSDDTGVATVIQSDGKVIVAGSANGDFALARYTTAGALDSTFGSAGKVTTAVGSGADEIRAVALQSDGKIIVGGYATNSSQDYALARYTSSGALDTSFGPGGKVVTAVTASVDSIDALVIQPDGMILVAGPTGNGKFTVSRYTSAGAVDTTFGFGTSGRTSTTLGTASFAHALALLTDGTILAAGESYNGSNYDFALVRYTSSGAMDTSFGTGGQVITGFFSGHDKAYAIAVQPDGKIVLGGVYTPAAGNSQSALVRYTSAGVLDTTFGTSGKVTTSMSTNASIIHALALQIDGKILTVGEGVIIGGGLTGITLARYTSSGAPDAAFGTSGQVLKKVGPNSDYGNAAALQSDGKIVITGTTVTTGVNSDIFVLRYS